MHHKSTSYDVWFLRCKVQTTKCFIIFGHFLPFDPPNNPKNQNFEKMKKPTGDIIILHNYGKNYDYRLYCSWDMVHGRCNCYFSFWAIFSQFCHPNSPNWKLKKKIEKRPLEISSFYTSVPKLMIICYTVPVWCIADVIIFHFGLFFALFCSFYTCIPKFMIICYTVPEIRHMTDVIVIFHFRLFFALLQPKKSKFQKN